MHRHIFLTGEIGCGKSTALKKTLELLPGVKAKGLQTHYSEPRGSEVKRLYLRAFGDAQPGTFLAELPGGDLSHIVSVFDGQGSALLEEAQGSAQLIVIDEIGRLERDAYAYQEALRRCIEGDVPMLCVIRKLKAPWADWIRNHPRVELLEVTLDYREDVPRKAALLARENWNLLRG